MKKEIREKLPKNFGKLRSKNSVLLADFTKYCRKHSDQRFWQALRNWADVSFVYINKKSVHDKTIIDTFYFENKND